MVLKLSKVLKAAESLQVFRPVLRSQVGRATAGTAGHPNTAVVAFCLLGKPVATTLSFR